MHFHRLLFKFCFTLLTLAGLLPAVAQEHALVIRGGRVIDPESGLDGSRDIGIDEGVITTISERPLRGRETIDASGLVVAPGFIDLHQHAWDDESLRLKAYDGVTSVLELEVGTAEVEAWYRERSGRSRLHHGVSIGHIPVRMKVMGDSPAFLPPEGARAISEEATSAQVEEMASQIVAGLDAGAVAVGFGLAYTPAATDQEIAAMFRAAASRQASCHIHLAGRGKSGSGQQALLDTAQLAFANGAAIHIVHFQAGARDTMGELLRSVEAMRADGHDISIECYPWTAGMTEIQSAIFAPGFQKRLAVDYGDLQWGATGERLNELSFSRYREQGGLVIVHNNTESAVTQAVNHPLMMIASDGLLGHPRNAGTYARVLGEYVRDRGELDLMSALRKMSLLPALRLERLAPMMKRKGRIQVGCDADLTLFDLQSVAAQATYEQPRRSSRGIPWVIVSGTPVIRAGQLVDDVYPGSGLHSEIPR
jgi:N-acyl-D-aspartate/D-glutamate deacylase